MKPEANRLYEIARKICADISGQIVHIEELNEIDVGELYDDLLDERKAYLHTLATRSIRAILMLYESLGFLHAYSDFIKETGRFDDLTAIEYFGHDTDHPFSPVNECVKEHLDMLGPLFDVGSSVEIERRVLRRVISQTAHLMAKRHKVPTKEHDVQDELHLALLGPWPDVVREPSIAQPTKIYKPDFGIASLSAAIEVKFVSNIKDVGKILGSLYEDIKGYSGSNWQAFYAVIYSTGAFTTQAILDAEALRVGTPKDWDIFLVVGNGGNSN